ncbi:hypothetical protein EHU46_22655, partial [Escherichia coli]|nr:hypothetical protein [Escherichia coli]
KGGQTPSAHQERPGCFPGVFRQPLTPIMGSIPTFIPEMNTGFNLLNKKWGIAQSAIPDNVADKDAG